MCAKIYGKYPALSSVLFEQGGYIDFSLPVHSSPYLMCSAKGLWL